MMTLVPKHFRYVQTICAQLQQKNGIRKSWRDRLTGKLQNPHECNQYSERNLGSFIFRRVCDRKPDRADLCYPSVPDVQKKIQALSNHTNYLPRSRRPKTAVHRHSNQIRFIKLCSLITSAKMMTNENTREMPPTDMTYKSAPSALQKKKDTKWIH
jgi:hypothetical protein